MRMINGLIISLSLFIGIAQAENSQPNTYQVGAITVTPERVSSTDWLGEPIMKSIRSYGIKSAVSDVLFLTQKTLDQVTQKLSGVRSVDSVYAVHIYGESGGSRKIENIVGLSVITESAGELTMTSYALQNQRFSKTDAYSAPVEGALDCDSIVNMAITLTPAGSAVKVVTLGRAHYAGTPKVDSGYSRNLAISAIELAMKRAKNNKVIFKDY